ncbi:hypothetical protein ACFLUV_03190 [Elusimicrobiota bacterium]
MLEKIKVIYGKWVKVGKKVAAFQVRILFTVAYFIIIVPFGLVFKLLTSSSKSGWKESKNEDKNSLEAARRQF